MNATTYFPYIKFRSTAWVKRAALFHDEVWRIIPAGYDTNDQGDVRALTEAGFLRSRTPSEEEIENAAIRFKSAYESHQIDRVWVAEGGPAEIHMQKISDRVVQFLASHGLHYPRKRDDWYAMPANAVSAYMAFLANEFARHIGGSITSDERRMLTVVDLVQAQDGAVLKGHARERIIRATFPILDLRDPANIPAESIIKFRETYADERKRFGNEVDRLALELLAITDPEDIAIFLNQKTARMAAALNELEAAARGLGIATAIRFCSALLNPLTGFTMEGVAGASLKTGFELLLTSIWQFKKQTKSPVAYLYQLRRHRAFRSNP